MKKPKALKTPFGEMVWTEGDDGDFDRCGFCRNNLSSWFDENRSNDASYRWFLKEKSPCPSCRPDLYVWEDEPKKAQYLIRCIMCEKGIQPSELTNLGYCGDCSVVMRAANVTIRGVEAEVIAVDEAKHIPEPPQESKPLRFVGHLAGCWATDRYQDNEHCGCWRIIKSEPKELYTVVGLPYTKLRGDWD